MRSLKRLRFAARFPGAEFSSGAAMKSSAVDVSAYLQEIPVDRRACLTTLRNLCLDTLAGYEEDMDYGMPSYKRDGVVEVNFASQKNQISLIRRMHR